MSWEEPVLLVGEAVRLEPLDVAHAPGLLAAADDDAVFEHLTVHRPTDVAAARAAIEHHLAAPRLLAWAQVTPQGEVAGVTTFYDVDAALRTVAIGHTWIGRRFWRTGLNTGAKLLLMEHAFETLGCVRVVWHTDLRNERSQAAIARLGAVREGVLRKHRRRRDGSWRDTVQYAMTDDDWPTAREALLRRIESATQ